MTFLAFALSLTALALPVSVAAANLSLFLTSLAIIGRLNADGRRRALSAWRAEPALAAVAAYIAAGLLAAALGAGPAHSLRDCAKDAHRLWALGVFVAALALEPEAPLWVALAAGFSLAAASGIFQSAFGRLSGVLVVRAHAFVHPVTFGEEMALAVLGGMCWLSRPAPEGKAARRLAAAATALCAAALVLSQTRAALLAVGVGAAVLAYLEPRARRWTAAAFGLGAVGAAAGQLLRYGRGGFEAASATSGPPAPSSGRFELWRAAWRMFRDHPWTGVGPGHYRTLFDRYQSSPLEGQADWGSAHNLYLHQLAERGLVGEAALAVLLGVLLVRAWRSQSARRDAAALWAACAVPAFLVMNLTETAFQTEQFATLFLLIWALGAARRTRPE